MQNSNELEKSKGVVVFAFNTSSVDYVKIADLTSRLTNHFLKLPITLITDNNSKPAFDYDQIVRIDYSGNNFRPVNHDGTAEWKNFGRYLAYELSPYDETILLDGDYLTLDDSLLKLWDSDFDYRLMYNSTTPDGRINNRMSAVGLDYVWATVVLFRKSARSKMLFDFVGRIQRNYSYYKTLYNGDGSYRNDYAFAMALNQINGHRDYDVIPDSIATVPVDVKILGINSDGAVLEFDNKRFSIQNQDLHIINKEVANV